MKKLALVLSCLIVLFSFTVQAKSKGEWIEIANKTASFKAETDEVKPSRAERNITKIKLHVEQGTVRIKNIKVFMSNGEEKEYDVLGLLNKGMETRALALPKAKEGEIKLQKIELTYDSIGNVLVSKKAKIKVLGFKKAKEEVKD